LVNPNQISPILPFWVVVCILLLFKSKQESVISVWKFLYCIHWNVFELIDNIIMSASSSLKTLQLAAIHRMLGLNSNNNTPNNSSALPQWKVLIYDAPCRSIISPLLSVSQLRACGVTLHLLLSSDREPIPDVPAVYFCEPTRANLQIIAQDCANGLYSAAHMNFVTKLPRYLMEEFAKLVVSTNSLDKVASVHDQYLDYVSLEKGMFSLYKKQNYVKLNESNANEESIMAVMDEIAYGLFSAVATVGMLPIIRCPKVNLISS